MADAIAGDIIRRINKKKRRFADYKQICREKWAEGERERVFVVLLLLLSSA